MKLFPTIQTPTIIRPLEIMGNDQDAAAPSLIQGTWRLVFFAFLPLVAWTFLFRIEDVAHVPGQIVPTGSVHTIQHLEGGIVKELLVKDNMVVEQGAILFRMDDTQSTAELEQIDSKINGLLARAIRTKAIANNTKPDFSTIPDRFKELANDQLENYHNQLQSLTNNRAIITAQIAQLSSKLNALKTALETAQQQVELTGKMLKIRQTLLHKKAISRIIYLETVKANETAQGEIKRLRSEIQNIQGAIDEANSRTGQLVADAQRVANDEMTSITNELAQVEAQRTGLLDRVNRMEIRAPVKGILQEVNTTSTVIQPGGMLAKIVPLDDKLQIEIHITPQDIGRINIREGVSIKLSSYSFVFFGRASGMLTSISPSTLLDEKQVAYFKGVVTLDKNYLGNEPGLHPILPGMLAQVDIALGERRVIEVLWQPLSQIIHDAFKEH